MLPGSSLQHLTTRAQIAPLCLRGLPCAVQVALQRKMFEQYEKRERQRKVAELQDVVPGLSVEEAEKALELCDGRWAGRCFLCEGVESKRNRDCFCTCGDTWGQSRAGCQELWQPPHLCMLELGPE